MPPHTAPSGKGYPLDRRHLTSANAGAFIHQSSLASSQAPIADEGGSSLASSAPIQENAGRDFGNPNSAFYLSYPCWPTISRAAAWQAGPYANPSQAHAAPRIHGATL